MVPKIECEQTEFLVILGHFLYFYTPNNLENQNFEKMKKAFYMQVPKIMIKYAS